MNLDRSICIHEAASNHDANLLAMFLNDEGIEALAVEDNSAVGLYALGALPGIHRPKVFVHRDDAKVALKMVARFEKKQPVSGKFLDSSFCYHCGAECKPDTETCAECGQTLDQDNEPGDCDLMRRRRNFQNEADGPPVQGFRKPVGMLPLLAGIIIMCILIIVCLSGLSLTSLRYINLR